MKENSEPKAKLRFEKAVEIDERVVARQRPPEEQHGAGEHQAGEEDDLTGLEPVEARAFLEHIFHAAEEGGHAAVAMFLARYGAGKKKA